jgi:hypothetical protein
MKTRRFFLFVLAIFAASLTFGQTVQQQLAVNKINRKAQQLIELKMLFQDIEDLKLRLNPPVGQYGPQELERKALEGRIDGLRRCLVARQRSLATNYVDGEDVQKDLERLQEQKRVLEEDFIAQAIEQSVPKEIAPREARRRHRSLGVRDGESSFEHKDKLRDLSIQKLENASVEADPVLGYKGILFNDTRYTKVTFAIKSEEGLDEVYQPLYAKESREIYLLPGKYIVHTYVDGYLAATNNLVVRPQANPTKINGKDYNFSVTRDKDGRY